MVLKCLEIQLGLLPFLIAQQPVHFSVSRQSLTSLLSVLFPLKNMNL